MYSAEELCKKLLDGLSVDEALASLPPYELRYIARIPVDVYCTAQRLGWRYFSEPRRGRPTWNHLRVNGASNDLEELMQWARSCPRWFLATGSLSGVFVLVVDCSDGQDSLIRLCSDDWTWLDTLRTQAGEQRFIFFQWPKGQRQISGSNCLGKGLYILGEGDWLRMPPSWELNGDPHFYIDPHPVARAAQWLLDLAFEPEIEADSSPLFAPGASWDPLSPALWEDPI